MIPIADRFGNTPKDWDDISDDCGTDDDEDEEDDISNADGDPKVIPRREGVPERLFALLS